VPFTNTTTTTTTTTLPVATTTSGTPTTTTSPNGSTTTPVSVPTPAVDAGAYYLIENNGGIHPYGGAGFYGSKAGKRLPAPIVAGAVSVDGAGYWLVTKDGNIYRYGDASFFGSPVHNRAKHAIVAMAATPDGEGYWVVSSSGAVYNYGDAQFCGSAVHDPVHDDVVGFAATPDGAGYWIVTASGSVYPFGDAAFYGSPVHRAHREAIVGMASTVDGLGYWLAAANGAVYPYGDAVFHGSPVHDHVARTVVSITSSADGAGYWVTTSSGRLFNFGDARFTGSLAHAQPRPPLEVVGLIRTSYAITSATSATSPFTHGAFGVDISNYQCSKTNPSSIQSSVPGHSTIAVVEVAGWLDSADNGCLASEAAWATGAAGANGSPFSLYLFVNSPGNDASAAALDSNGPAGKCTELSDAAKYSCQAYDYGYNGAKDALGYAASAGVVAKVWWLDVEGARLSQSAYSDFPSAYWSDSTTLNDQTIQGALDALHQGGVVAGIYSTSIQFPEIAGAFVPSGPRVPLWVAGVPWTNPPYTEHGLDSTSILAQWCAGTATYAGSKATDGFAGGVPWLLQETPGNEASPYGLDPDYSC